MSDSSSPLSEAGLLGSLKRLGTTALSALETRLDLLGTDVEREGLRLVRLLVWGAACLFFLFVGIILLVLLLVYLAGEEHRASMLAVLSGLSLAAAVGIAIGVRGWIRSQPKPFEATRAELARDRERMNS